MMKSVKKDEIESPKITADPSAVQVALESVIGIMPAMVTMEVIKIASSLDFPASIIDSLNGMPVLILRFILSIKIMAFLTTIPKRAKMPINPGKLNVTPKRAIPMKTPISANGSVTSTMMAFLNELN